MKAHNDANDVVASEEEKVQNLGNGLTEAVSMKEKSDDSLAAANEAELEATGKKTDADSALKIHVEEEKTLQPKKLTMEGELQGLREVQEIARGPADPSKKEGLKVQKALRDVEAPEALILGIGAAIGKQTMMDQHFVNEATKLLFDKSTTLEGELATFNETVEEYAKKQKKQGEKSLEKAVLSRDAAGSAEEVGKDTKTHYTFLFDRSAVVVEPEPVAPSPVSVPVSAAASPVSAPLSAGRRSPRLSSAGPSPVAAPEAAMEFEPVA